MNHIFLSYSRENKAIMQRVKQFLLDTGLRVWTDENIQPGTMSWQIAIEKQIDTTGCLVCILSPAAKQSQWVREELNYARARSKPIYLLLASGDESSSVPFGFSTFQWLDIRDEHQFDKEMDILSEEIQRRLELQADDTIDTPVSVQIQQNEAYADAPDVLSVLPEPFEWCFIPESEFSKAFFIAKYPITQAQYKVFLDDEAGYQDESWWKWDVTYRVFRWHKEQKRLPSIEIREPDLPCTRLNWYEAIAFCFWLSDKVDASIILPTDKQWLYAASGDESLLYPWGNDFSVVNANTYDSEIRNLTPVDRYPQGASPFGVMDMAGNAWEWCLTEPDTHSNALSGGNKRILRGASWFSTHEQATTQFKSDMRPNRRGVYGFRLACDALPVE